MTLEDLSIEELQQAQDAEMVIVDNGDGTFDVLKDRAGDDGKYTIESLLQRLNDVNGSMNERTTMVLWVKT